MSEQGELWDCEALAGARAWHSRLVAETVTGGAAQGRRSLATHGRLLSVLAPFEQQLRLPWRLSLLHAECPDR
jgi:hypothetical protein